MTIYSNFPLINVCLDNETLEALQVPDNYFPRNSHFVKRFSREYDKRIIGLSPEAMWNVRSWRYPGNVRELQNVIERAVALCPGNIIQVEDLPEVVSKYMDFKDLEVPDEFPEGGINLDEMIATMEKKWLLASLRATNGKKTAAAELLMMSFRSFRYRLIKHNLDG